ncbi:MAG: hypothetical protein P8Y95_09760, partial [Gammaproteobacteria bacterium]
MPIRRYPSFWFLAMVLSACQGGTEGGVPTVEEDLAQIAVARDALTAAIAQDDVDGIMAQLTGDHLTMPPDTPTLPNNEALRQWHQARVDEYTFRSDFVTNEI